MFRAVRPVLWSALAAAAASAPAFGVACDSWTINPAPEGYVFGQLAVTDPDGPGLLETQLVMPNAFTDMTTFTPGVGLWDGSSLTQFGPFSTNNITAVGDDNGRLVVGGVFAPDGVTPSVVIGDGSTWTSIAHTGGDGLTSGPLGSGDWGIYAFAVYGGKLIAAGAFTGVDGVSANSIAAWNGTTWEPLGTGTDGVDGSIKTMVVDTVHNVLYVGGLFSHAGGNAANDVAAWNGSSWSALGGGVGQDRGFLFGVAVNALAVYNGKIIVGGSFAAVGGADATDPGDPNIQYTIDVAAWDPATSTWSTFGTGLDELNPTFAGSAAVSTLTVVNNVLYAGGVLDDADGVAVAEGLAQWNGSHWSSVGASSLDTTLSVSALSITTSHAYQGNLFVAGYDFDVGLPFLATYTPPCPCPADFDGNSTVNVSDIFAFLRAWFAHSASADIDGNSVVNVSDIFAFLRHWFAHC